MLLLIPPSSLCAGRCSSVPVRAVTGSMIMQTLVFDTQCCCLISRRKKGALCGLNYCPSLMRIHSLRYSPHAFTSTSNSVDLLFLSCIKTVSVKCSVSCQLLQLMLLIMVASDGLCGLLYQNCSFSC